MGRRRTHVTYHGRLQIVHGFVKDHWCGLDPYLKAKMLTFAIDYYSFKLKTYNMQLQAIIDHKKYILDIFVVMPWSMNNTQVLHLSSIYQKVKWGNLFNEHDAHEGMKFYIIGDKDYPLMPWLMVLHKQTGIRRTILKTLFNKQLFHVRIVVDNNFGILKKTFVNW